MRFSTFKTFVAVSALCVSVSANAALTDGLVAYYPFNGNANDSSGYGNHGTVSGATLTTDRNGNANSAYQFDGISHYIEIPASNSLDTRYSISIFSWVLSQGSDGPIVAYDPLVTDNYDFGVHLWETSNIDSAADGFFTRFVTRSGVWTDYLLVANVLKMQWKFIGASYDYSTGIAKLYSDGQVISTKTIGKIELGTQHPIRIGMIKIDPYGNRIFKGKIDEIRIYNRAISATEVQQLYAQGTSSVPTTDPACLLKPIGCGATVTATVSSANGTAPLTIQLNASLVNAPSGSVSYQWRSSTGQTASGSAAFMTITTPGTHTITLTATDSQGYTSTVQKTVTVSGSSTSAGECVATYSPTTGTLNIPYVAVPVMQPFGGIQTSNYSVEMQQRHGSFTFDLLPNSVVPR